MSLFECLKRSTCIHFFVRAIHLIRPSYVSLWRLVTCYHFASGLQPWGQWSSCSASCGNGVHWRQRTCSNGTLTSCIGNERSVEQCSQIVPCVGQGERNDDQSAKVFFFLCLKCFVLCTYNFIDQGRSYRGFGGFGRTPPPHRPEKVRKSRFFFFFFFFFERDHTRKRLR